MQLYKNKPIKAHTTPSTLTQTNNGNKHLFVGLAFSRNPGPNRNEVPQQTVMSTLTVQAKQKLQKIAFKKVRLE